MATKPPTSMQYTKWVPNLNSYPGMNGCLIILNPAFIKGGAAAFLGAPGGVVGWPRVHIQRGWEILELNGGKPKLFVCYGKSHWNGWSMMIWGHPYFRKPAHIYKWRSKDVFCEIIYGIDHCRVWISEDKIGPGEVGCVDASAMVNYRKLQMSSATHIRFWSAMI